MEHFSIEINKDFGNFKNNFALGYTLSEWVCIISALIICAIVILPLTLILHVDIMIAGYAGLIPAVTILYCGFYKKAGLSFREYHQKLNALKEMKNLHYESNESIENLMIIMEEEQKEAERILKEANIANEKKRSGVSILKKAVCAVFVIIAVGIATITTFHVVKNHEMSKIKKEQIANEMQEKEKKIIKETASKPTTTAVSKKTTEKKETLKTASATKKETTTEKKETVSSSSSVASSRSSTSARSTTQERKSYVTKTKKKKTRINTANKKTAERKTSATTAKKKKTTTERKEDSGFQVEYNTN